ncbi:MAG: O-antigen ligase family protein [Mariniblastus sp.]
MNPPDKLPNMTLEAIVSKKDESSDGSGGSQKPRETSSISDRFSWPGRIAILLAIVFSPWVFASVESWAQSWVAILLLIGVVFWWFETALNEKKSQVFPYIFFPILLGLLIGLIQTVSLPGWLADMLLGRQQEIYANFGGEANTSAPISLDRGQTWDQIRLLIIASLGLLLGCRYFRTKRDLILLMSAVAANGVAISFFGIIHKLTDNGLMFWYHKVELGGQHFGPFVNRNNGAGYLCMCLACAIGLLPIVMAARKNSGPQTIVSKEIPIWRQLAMHLLEFISELTATKLAVLISSIVISAGIVATLSRGGVLAMLVGGAITILIYGMARRPKNSFLVLIPFIALAIGFSAWIGFSEQLTERFEKTDIANISTADARFQNWKDTWPAVGDMGVLGSGLGSYRSVHRLYRTDEERAIFVYAENQFFQALVEAGWLALILFLVAWFLAFQYSKITLFQGKSPTTIGVGTMGTFLLVSQFVASIFDFGFYICANMLLLAVLVGFLAFHGHSLAGRLKKKSWLRFQLPNYVTQVVVLLLFAAGTLVALDLHRRGQMDRFMKPIAKNFERETMSLEEVDFRIARLSEGLKRVHSVNARNYLGELWLYRSRLTMFDVLLNAPEYKTQIELIESNDKADDDKADYVAKQKKALTDDMWARTDILQLYDVVCFCRQQSRSAAVDFIKQPSISENLPQAANQFLLSRRASPLQPVVHLKLGEINAVVGKSGDADAHLERALQLAPTNSSFRLLAGVTYLLSGNSKFAAIHFRKHLELMPTGFKKVIDIVTASKTLSVVPLSDEVIANQVIPDDANMLFKFDQDYMSKKLDLKDSPLRQQLLANALSCIDEEKSSRRENAVLRGDIYRVQGEVLSAINEYEFALVNRPNDHSSRYKLIKLLEDSEDWDGALKHVEKLRPYINRAGSGVSKKYKEFSERIGKKKRKQDRKK